MKHSNFLSFILVVSALGLSACGSGVDPLQIVAGNSTIPQLGSISTGSLGGQITAGFTPTTPYWTFGNLASFGNYISPADGIVSKIGIQTIAGQSLVFINIVHSARLSTRFSGVPTPIVRVGDTVVATQPVGTFFNGGGVIFQVLLDGNPVCPLSFMSDSFRANFTSWAAFNPCQ